LEFLLLAERGRVRVRDGQAPLDWVETALSRVPMHDAPLSRGVAIRSRSVRLDYEDPADRLLAARADVYELALVTADERVLRGKGFRTLPNR
jgi:PIN domain nuclease of toxin-antitoxin system